jgi:protein required for attachment to host cells
MAGGMASTMFGEMRKELHHKVVAGIFGEENND